MNYELTPIKKLNITRNTGGKVNKMTKQTKVTEKATRSYNKTRGEHLKDIIIAILIVGVVAFIAGVHYSDTKNAQMQSAVQSAQQTAVKK